MAFTERFVDIDGPPTHPLPFAALDAALDKMTVSGAFTSAVLVLTTCRSDEVRLATWDEVNLKSGTRTVMVIPMKAERGHRMPLSAHPLEILHQARELSNQSGLVFPSAHGCALSDNTISKLLRDLGVEAVPHGFRSSFWDWAAECSDAPREVCELALAHVNSNKVRTASRRTNLFEWCRVLIEDWSKFVAGSADREEDQSRK